MQYAYKQSFNSYYIKFFIYAKTKNIKKTKNWYASWLGIDVTFQNFQVNLLLLKKKKKKKGQFPRIVVLTYVGSC